MNSPRLDTSGSPGKQNGRLHLFGFRLAVLHQLKALFQVVKLLFIQ